MKTSTLTIILLMFGLGMLLSGCANLKFAWSASYQTDNLAADLRQAREEPKALPPISYRIGK